MSYYFNKILNCSFDEAIDKTTKSLNDEGFGVLTDIDVKDTLKKKIDVDFHDYRILGACNPNFAYQALLKEDKIGTMLPCSVVVQSLGNDKVEVVAIDPIASMSSVQNPELETVAIEVQSRLKKVIENLK